MLRIDIDRQVVDTTSSASVQPRGCLPTCARQKENINWETGFKSLFAASHAGRGFLSSVAPILALSLFVSLVCGASESDAAIAVDDKTKVSLTIVTETGEPIPGVQVEIRLWGGKGEWVETVHRGATNDRGQMSFEGLVAGRLLSVLARAPGYAPSMQDFQLGRSEHRQIRFVLSRPVKSWFRLTTDGGKPISGADVAYLEIRDANNSMFVVRKNGVRMLYPDFALSNEKGHLVFPALPRGGKITCKLVHPDWVAVRPTQQNIVDGEIGHLTMHAGAQITLQLLGDQDVLRSIENSDVLIRLFSDHDDPDHRVNARIIHEFKVVDSKIEFTAHSDQYSDLRVWIDDFHVTPAFSSGPFIDDPVELDFKHGEALIPLLVRATKDFEVQLKLPIGEPCAGAWVYASTDNLIPTPGSEIRKRVSNYQWTSVGSVQTDENGLATLKIPPGPAKVAMDWSGYYLKDDFVQISLPNDPSDQPISVVMEAFPFPVLRGRVIDNLGRPSIGAIVRPRSQHYLGEMSYFRTDESGEFEIPLTTFPRTRDRKRTDCLHLVAFESTSGQGAISRVDLYDENSFGQVQLHLQPRNPEWVLSALPGEFDAFHDNQDLLEEWRSKYPLGSAGNPVPDMSKGTWLNTDARSLEDFRGKFVMLDFWFIGCGPCMRDMPSVKLAHELYAEQGFTVVAVHTSMQTAENVQQFANANQMNYPIVVDNQAGDIVTQYEQIALHGYPTYILLDPEGKIVTHDALGAGPSLRLHKLELIHREIRRRFGDK